MPLLDLRQARADIRLAEVLELLGWGARARRGLQVRGPCPLQGPASARSRSFAAHRGKGCWQCFRCGAAGNALDLGAWATRQELDAAVHDLYRRLRRALPWLPPDPGYQTGARLRIGSEPRKDRETMHDP